MTKFNNSDIFNSFAKIAKEKGLIEPDKDFDKTHEKTKKEIYKNKYRADSLSIKDIEHLYNVKPPAPKDMEYIRNIIENAHKDPLMIADSYDKINGLIENQNERHDIIVNILSKVPNGLLTQHKYAQKDLILSLVRLGNFLDTNNLDKLANLSDHCLQKLSKPIKKEAFTKQAFPFLIAGAVVILGVLYAQQHMADANEGFEQNHEKLMSELNDFLESNDNWGVGYQYTAEFKQTVSDFKDKLTKFHDIYNTAIPYINNFEKPRTGKELAQVSSDPSKYDGAKKAYDAIKSASSDMNSYMKTVIQDFKSTNYKNRQIQEKGFFSSLIDRTQVLHGGSGLIADDFDDVIHAITPYQQSIQDILKVLMDAENFKNAAAMQLQQSADNAKDNVSQPSKPSFQVGQKAKQIDDQTENDLSSFNLPNS